MVPHVQQGLLRQIRGLHLHCLIPWLASQLQFAHSLPQVLNLIQDTFAFVKELQWVQGHCKLRVTHQHQSNFSLQPCGHGNSGLGRVFRLAGGAKEKMLRKGFWPSLSAHFPLPCVSLPRFPVSLHCSHSSTASPKEDTCWSKAIQAGIPGSKAKSSQEFALIATPHASSASFLFWGSLFRILYQAASVDRRPCIPGQLSARGAEASAPGLKAWLCSEPRVSMHFIRKVLMMPDPCRSLRPFRVRWRSSRLADSGSPNRYGADELFSGSRNAEVCS